MEDQLSQISQKIEEIKSNLHEFGISLTQKDQIIQNKDERISDLMDKLVSASKEKDEALWAKIELMKEIAAEREQTQREIIELKMQLLEKDEKIKKLKQKQRQAQDGLIGTSFEVDRMKKEVEEKERKIQEIKEKADSVSMGLTGIIYELDLAVDYLKDRIKNATRSLRIVVPTVEFLQEHEILEQLEQLPDSSVVNIATSLNLSEHQEIIEGWKNRGWVVTNYPGKNFFMISADGSDVCIAFTAGTQISGFYSNIGDLVTIFNQALMYPFIKGQKL
ncbi:MAG: hypothetical protein DRO88_06635 [Promethearchaeia archaeon]|nr:MAG: hypothetical protein DRO88_06635 [Candidatus Lokiarchaeia archaeon]